MGKRTHPDVSETNYADLGETDEGEQQKVARDRALRKALVALWEENREGGGGFQYDQGGIEELTNESLTVLAEDHTEDTDTVAKAAVDALKQASPGVALRYTDSELLILPIKAICGLPTFGDEYEQHYFGESSDSEDEDYEGADEA